MSHLKPKAICLLVLLLVLVYYAPILINPNLLLGRDNDLQEQFWPVFYFIREQFWQNHSLPLWNNMFLSGTPLLPDPQFSLFYPLNWVFIIFPTDPAAIIYLLTHSFLAGLGMYLLSKHGFNFSQRTSLLLATLYLFTPKIAGYLVAGHLGLIATHSWIPLLALSVILIARKPSIYQSILLSISLAGIFFTHTVIFAISGVTSLILFSILFFLRKPTYKSLIFLFLGLTLTFGLIAVTLLPQLEWLPQTNRFLLLQDRDVYPKWSSIYEIFKATFAPWSLNVWTIDSEKWLTLGVVPLILALFGFIRINRKAKVVIFGVGLAILLFSLNNVSPIKNLLISQDWFVLTRVATRVWFIIILLTSFLIGFGIESISKKYQRIVWVLAIISILELLTISWIKFFTPLQPNKNNALPEVIEYLKQDPDRFRVFCINRCISQKDAAINHLELIEGYNPLIQENYNQQAWQLTGAYWKNYSQAIPPIGTYTFEKPQPDPISLGEYNVKYIISTYPLIDKNFILKMRFNEYSIYTNFLFKSRNYLIYTPNHIRVMTKNQTQAHLNLPEVYSAGWNAYINGKVKTQVQEKPNSLRLIDLPSGTEFVDLRYEPTTFAWGKIITITSLFIISLTLIHQKILKRQK